MYDSIIFDLDGTLWDSTPEAELSYSEYVKTNYPEVTDEITIEKLKGLFGRPLEDIGVELFKSISEDEAKRIIIECAYYGNAYIAKNGAMVYEGLEETLKELAKHYKLFIVSNCEDGYIECFLECYPNLKPLIQDFECPGNSGKFKADNIRLIMERNKLKNPIYLGDTLGDAQACKEAGVPFIFASYGFGDVKEYDRKVNSLGELLEIFIK